jgi:lysophospholipase L1-like esterase
VIVLLGNNDIIFGQLIPGDAVTSEQIIQAHQMLIERAHLRGLTIYGATLTPFKGALDESLFPAAEAQRQAVNAWIRTSGEYDAVIDFDLAVRDQHDPAQLDPLRRADFLHPDNDGYAAMADAIDLTLFKSNELQ